MQISEHSICFKFKNLFVAGSNDEVFPASNNNSRFREKRIPLKRKIHAERDRFLGLVKHRLNNPWEGIEVQQFSFKFKCEINSCGYLDEIYMFHIFNSLF